MPEGTLFSWRKFSDIDVKRIYAWTLLSCFSLFMIGGNLLRVVPIPGFSNNHSIVELGLYALSFSIFFSRIGKALLICLAVLLSCLYGIFLHGFIPMAILYAIKLIGMILAGVAVGRSLAYLFPEKEKAHLFVVWTFMACALAGAVLYFVFPKASLLYPFLEQFGIVFEGDPHVHRFLSPLLDPNFYGAIACIPLILLFAMRKEGISFYLLLGSLILTWSRSGIATCILTLGVAGLHRLFQVKSAPLRSIGFPAALIGGAALILGFAGNRVAQFGSRLLAVFEDPSSLERLVNTEVALPFFWEFPLFGMGYNFLSPVYSAESTLSTPDSSLFFSTLTFGLIPTLVLLGLFTFWVLQLGKKCRGNPTFSLLVTYASICLLFTSQFNNLIFYQYWLIPMIALFTHMEKTAQ